MKGQCLLLQWYVMINSVSISGMRNKNLKMTSFAKHFARLFITNINSGSNWNYTYIHSEEFFGTKFTKFVLLIKHLII
jgi:hypothetical protein